MTGTGGAENSFGAVLELSFDPDEVPLDEVASGAALELVFPGTWDLQA